MQLGNNENAKENEERSGLSAETQQHYSRSREETRSYRKSRSKKVCGEVPLSSNRIFWQCPRLGLNSLERPHSEYRLCGRQCQSTMHEEKYGLEKPNSGTFSERPKTCRKATQEAALHGKFSSSFLNLYRRNLTGQRSAERE